MRKLLVRILNLVYLAAAAISLWSLYKKPIITLGINIDMNAQQVGEIVAPLVNGDGSETENSETRLVYREEKQEKEINDYLTPEKIATAFEETDGIHQTINIEVPSKYAFNLKKTDIITELVIDNIHAVIDTTLNTLVTPLRNLILAVTEEFAKEALRQAVNATIQSHFAGQSDATTEQINEIYNNIFEVLDNNEPVPVTALTDLIISGKKDEEGNSVSASAISILNENPYKKANPQPTSQDEIDAEPEKYFVKNEEGEYVQATTYDVEQVYYVSHVYTEADINTEQIEERMVDALNSVPGLVNTEYIEAPLKGNDLKNDYNNHLESQHFFFIEDEYYKKAVSYDEGTEYYIQVETYTPISSIEQDVIDNTSNYFIKNESDDYVQATEYNSEFTYYAYEKHYEPAHPTESEFNSDLISTKYYLLSGEEFEKATGLFNETNTYYIYQTTINDIDTALTALISQYLLGTDSSSSGENTNRAYKRVSRAESSLKSTEELRKVIKDFILQLIPLDQIEVINVQYGKYAPYALLAIIVFFALPWAWFAFITLIRTLRPRKCWTRPGIIIFWAFPQILLGIILTYGINYAIPLAAQFFEPLKAYADVLGINLKFSCLIPSFAYLGVIALTFVYKAIVTPVKVEYKFEKVLERRGGYVVLPYNGGGRYHQRTRPTYHDKLDPYPGTANRYAPRNESTKYHDRSEPFIQKQYHERVREDR